VPFLLLSPGIGEVGLHFHWPRLGIPVICHLRRLHDFLMNGLLVDGHNAVVAAGGPQHLAHLDSERSGVRCKPEIRRFASNLANRNRNSSLPRGRKHVSLNELSVRLNSLGNSTF
jgi:hypothetical protein